MTSPNNPSAPSTKGSLSTDDADGNNDGKKKGWFSSIGPAIIVASVVLGPGSIFLASAIGAEFGYALLWVPLFSTALMICLVMISSRLGVTYERTLLEELAHKLGRPVAAFLGLIVFLITASFQTGNNAAILFAIDPLLEMATNQPAEEIRGGFMSATILVLLNGFILAVLFGFRKLYPPLEKIMIGLVMIMLLGFFVNLMFAEPSVLEIGRGLIPSFPQASEGQAPLNWTLVFGFFATTVSIGAVFYQSYLVKEKGWKIKDVKSGMTDSILGIALLGLISAIIMITAAAVLYDATGNSTLGSAGDVARQLEPLFGPAAVILFSLGLFAGALSSFMVNAMVGGTLLADGLGLGGMMDQKATRMFTAAALLLGMTIALISGGTAPSEVITFAQALTILGLPILSLGMIYLVTRPELTGERAFPIWMKVVLIIGFMVILLLAVRTANNLFFS